MSKKVEKNQPFLVATLDRYENDKAVLVFSDSQQLLVSKELLFDDYKEGDSIVFFLTGDKNAQSAKENFAKIVLDVLLKKS